MARSRPAQGNNSKPVKPGRARYVSEATPKVVSSGSVSRPAKPPKWSPQNQAAPRRVASAKTIA